MNLALDSQSPADIPQLVQQILDQLGLNKQIRTDEVGLANGQKVQSALLGDAIGTLLVLYPRDSLLDLARLAELTGRQLTPVGPEQLRQLLGRHGLEVLPSLPLPNGSPCLYEARLAEQSVLWLASGQRDLLLETTGDGFRRLLDKGSAGRFGVPLSSIRPNLDRPHDDRQEITRAVETFTARRIRQRLEETLEIPPLPQTANRIIKLRVDPKASVDDVTDVVETDPALAAQVVSWAASPYYGAPGKIRSVEDAIVRVLGFDLVINLALGLALGKRLSLPKDEPQQATPYWQQAIYTAAVVDGLLRSMPRALRPEPGLGYLGGLLHNFGYLVLAHVFPPHFALFRQHREVNPHLHHSLIEQHLLGISREQIGSWLMRHWGMPEELCVALRFQQDPHYQGEHAAYANLICLAVRLLGKRGIGSDPVGEIPGELYARLGIDPEKAENALDKVLDAEAALREMARQMNGPSR
ncbi:aminoacyl-tRNA deacylase and HDOD domain-containing protein [Stutzerimonas tarimensis]|uniref:HDOD domain-containing protein n=1 Tax=Stutzerimonas tarimensis TaxID=1507735 RepID=A0ABV7T510_9GAMM